MKIGHLKINFGRLGIFIFIGVMLFLVMNFNTRLGELSLLQNQEATVAAQATGVMLTQEVLQTQVAEATSPGAVDAYAHGEAHMGKPGDHVVIVMPVPGASPSPTPVSTLAVNDRKPLDVWSLFIFGN
jgi:hypothetical protein